ncbi:MAG: hypothetical protein R3B82_09745 [Sandaracinaceae bacterium]
MTSESRRVAIAIAGLVGIVVLVALAWPREGGSPFGGGSVGGSSQARHPGGGVGDLVDPRRDAGAADVEETADGRRRTGGGDDPSDVEHGQDQSVVGRTDGAVPYVATPPYQSPTEGVVELTTAELNRRRLEQVGLIEQQIASLDQEIEATVDGPRRTSLMARREHLEGRRADLLAVVADER